ncbi:GNAT family N-acetyltransferase [Croceitalea vernalis]|uniref:GNAT family N-acetyltransferase n=1 Tax=Croceitalea vernalis TaxID=3075599 RepID=A0ABU3BI23_9FLAO|nr:GNAT family N-acetyltransferase [Croceitalea sp. P007]MDT0621812.1 GNAT family N-acetyltransferase [Croceitalea sp. P007]
MTGPTIRKIEAKDNQQVAKLIRNVFEELEITKVGTAYEDEELDCLYEAYQNMSKAEFYVIVQNNKIIGCGGFAPLANQGKNICELQKMYFLPELRGQGFGQKLITICLNKARGFKYDSCYLETMPHMKTAQKLYQKNGFSYLEEAMGCTGHSSCPVYMIKNF